MMGSSSTIKQVILSMHFISYNLLIKSTLLKSNIFISIFQLTTNLSFSTFSCTNHIYPSTVAKVAFCVSSQSRTAFISFGILGPPE
jgi:hypothetical protein